jgi:hypothetical protein
VTTDQLTLVYSTYTQDQLLQLHNQLTQDLEEYGDYNNYFSSLNYYHIKRINVINYLLKRKGEKNNVR